MVTRFGARVVALLFVLVGLGMIINGCEHNRAPLLAVGGLGLWVISLSLILWAGRDKQREIAEEKDARERAEEEKARRAHEDRVRREERIKAEVQAEYAPAAPRVEVREKIVERHILVMRCKFCSKLTPADLKACENCGAQGFG